MEKLTAAYNRFINQYDPYSQEAQPDTFEGMLYNLLAIKEDADAWKDDFPELYETLEATIQQFKAAGIEIF